MCSGSVHKTKCKWTNLNVRSHSALSVALDTSPVCSHKQKLEVNYYFLESEAKWNTGTRTLEQHIALHNQQKKNLLKNQYKNTPIPIPQLSKFFVKSTFPSYKNEYICSGLSTFAVCHIPELVQLLNISAETAKTVKNKTLLYTWAWEQIRS